MRPKFAVCSALAATLVLALAAPAGAVGGEEVPLPGDDPFYAVPDGLDDLANGTVLKSRRIDAAPLHLPVPAAASHVQYRSTDSEHRPTAAITTILVPLTPWLEPGPRPLLSYQSAINGVSQRCAPSYAMRAGLDADFTNANLESATFVRTAVARGWAVSVPDHLGPLSTYGARASGHHVLDGIRAAANFAPAGIDRDAPVGLWGYSGGALASAQAANIQATYAPEIPTAGIALGGLPADFKATLESFDGDFLFGLVILGIIGLDRAYSSIDLASYANERGKRALEAEQDSCANDVAAKYPFGRIADYVKDPAVFDRPEIVALLRDNSPLGIPGAPLAPVYSYHSVNDQLAPVEKNRELLARYCAAGVAVQRYEDMLSEHVALTATGAPAAFAYLGDRFAGEPAPDDC